MSPDVDVEAQSEGDLSPVKSISYISEKEAA